MPNVKKLVGDKVTFAKDEYEALDGADALVIATEWALFRTPDFGKVAGLLKGKVIFDGRNLYDLDEMEKLGFTYVSVGRQTVGAKKPVNA
jgi:UDPglucose 6-dehydrogenase